MSMLHTKYLILYSNNDICDQIHQKKTIMEDFFLRFRIHYNHWLQQGLTCTKLFKDTLIFITSLEIQILKFFINSQIFCCKRVVLVRTGNLKGFKLILLMFLQKGIFIASSFHST